MTHDRPVIDSILHPSDLSEASEVAFAHALNPIRQSIADRETALGRVLERDAASFHSRGHCILAMAGDQLGDFLTCSGCRWARAAVWLRQLPWPIGGQWMVHPGEFRLRRFNDRHSRRVFPDDKRWGDPGRPVSWAAYVLADGRFITRQKPASGGAVAALVIEQLAA
jgi:hypothetical protein